MGYETQQNVLKGGVNMRKWLKEKRINKGMSQQNVAEKLGITQQYYNLIENAERKKELDVSLLTKLSGIFEISIEEIVRLENS